MSLVSGLWPHIIVSSERKLSVYKGMDCSLLWSSLPQPLRKKPSQPHPIKPDQTSKNPSKGPSDIIISFWLAKPLPLMNEYHSIELDPCDDVIIVHRFSESIDSQTLSFMKRKLIFKNFLISENLLYYVLCGEEEVNPSEVF